MATSFQAPERPKFIPYGGMSFGTEIGWLDKLGLEQDKAFYNRSDADFKKRHPGILKAEKLFEGQVEQDQKGESELMPAVQNEFMRANIGAAAASFGDKTHSPLKPGGAGEASVARNLGLRIMDFQDRNRRNRLTSLLAAEGIFPRRSFGLSGSDAVTVSMLNTQGQNNWNQADYSTRFQQAQAEHNAGIASENAAAQGDAAQSGAAVQGGAAIASAAVMALALTCRIARAVYGEESNDWRVFRHWLLLDAPKSVLDFYRRNGEVIAKAVNASKTVKAAIRGAFNIIIRVRRAQWA